MYGSLSRTTQIHCTYQRWATWLECQVPASKHQSLKQTLKRKSLTSSPLPPKRLNISSLFSFMNLHVWYHLEGGSINTRANGMLCSNQSESQAIVAGNHAPPLRSGHLPLPGFIHFLRFTSHFKGSFSLPKTMSIATFNATHIYPQLRCLTSSLKVSCRITRVVHTSSWPSYDERPLPCEQTFDTRWQTARMWNDSTTHLLPVHCWMTACLYLTADKSRASFHLFISNIL